MKFKLIYLFPVFVLFALVGGCIGHNNPAPISGTVPTGTFTGQFARLHLNSKTGKVDTTTANLVLNMETATGFKLTGDTSNVHAGSYGSYIINSTYTAIEFIDKTYPSTGISAKTHLSGIYQYAYDSKNLEIEAYGALDTLAFFYTMVKSGN